MEKINSVAGSYAAASLARANLRKLASRKHDLIARVVLTAQAWRQIALGLGMTHRELQIVKGIFANLKEAGIAGRLNLSSHTVHAHLNRLFRKLRVTTRTELLVRVIEELCVITLRDGSPLPPICPHRMNGKCRVRRCGTRL